MRRKPTPFPSDDVSRLRRLLGMVEPAMTDEERAAFVPAEPVDAPPPDRFAGRRAFAWCMEREHRRGPDGRLRRRKAGEL